MSSTPGKAFVLKIAWQQLNCERVKVGFLGLARELHTRSDSAVRRARREVLTEGSATQQDKG